MQWLSVQPQYNLKMATGVQFSSAVLPDKFDPEIHDWEAFVEQFSNAMALMSVTDATTKKRQLVARLSQPAFILLRNMVDISDVAVTAG